MIPTIEDQIKEIIEQSTWSENEYLGKNTYEDKHNFLEINSRIAVEKLTEYVKHMIYHS